MTRLSLAVLAILVSVVPARATGGVYCDGVRDDTVSAYLTVGRVPGFAVVGARIMAKGQSWDMQGAEGAMPIALAQGAVIGDLTVADFTDPNHERIVASLRVVRADNDDGFAAGGVVSIPGLGAWPVVCEMD